MNEHESTIEPGNGAAHIDERAERIKRATSSAVTSTKDAVDRAADRVEDGLHRATDKAAEVGERGREVYDETKERADEWLETARDYVREKPVQSVAIALGAGWLLGRILRG